MAEHLTEDIIARGNLARPNPAEDGGSGEPRIVMLRLDDDTVYRWHHEDGTSTEVSGPDIHSAFAAARTKWPAFELLEYRNHTVEPGNEKDIVNTYATDERENIENRAGK